MEDSSIQILMSCVDETSGEGCDDLKKLKSQACDVIPFPFLLFGVLIFWVVLFLFVAFFVSSQPLPVSRWVVIYLIMPFIVIVLCLPLLVFLKWYVRRDLRKLSVWLVTQKIRPHTCLLCRYDLKHSNSPACPECGAELYVVEA